MSACVRIVFQVFAAVDDISLTTLGLLLCKEKQQDVTDICLLTL